MSENLVRKTYKGFFWQFGGTAFTSILQLGVLVILARLVPKADFGIVQSALVIVGFSNVLSQMGVGPALVQKTDLTSLHIRAGSTLSMLLSLVLFIITFCGAHFWAVFFKMPELEDPLKTIAFLFVVEGLTTVSQSLLLRAMRQKTLVKIDLISYLFGYGLVAIVLSLYGFGLWAIIYGQLVQSILKCILSFIMSNHSVKPYWGKKEIAELLRFGGGFTLARFFNYLANQGDNIITGRYLGAEALGIYSRAYTIMVRPVTLIGDSLDKALFPAMSNRQGEKDKLLDAFLNGSKMIFFLCFPISIAIIFSTNEIVNVLLGSTWQEAIIPLQILTAGLIFRIGYKMGDVLTKATGNVYRRAKRNMIYALMVLVGCYIGSFWGIIGVSIGTLFAIIVNYILMIHLSLVILKISWGFFLRCILVDFPISFLLATIFIIILLFTRFFTSSPILILLTVYGAYMIVCIYLFYYFGRKLSFLNVLPYSEKIKKFIKKEK